MALVFPIPYGDKFMAATPPHTSPGSASMGKNHNCKSHSSLLAQDPSAFTQIYHYNPGNLKQFSNVPIMVPGMMSAIGVSRRGQVLT